MAALEINDILADQKRLGQLVLAMSLNISNPAAAEYNLSDLEVRDEQLDVIWKQFMANDLHANRVADQIKERSYIKSQYFLQISNAYLQTKSFFKTRIKSLMSSSVSQAVHTVAASSASVPVAQAPAASTSSALEPVSVPDFSGKQQDWNGFKEQFEALVINDQSCATIIKFRRLKEHLKDQAAQAISHIALSAENFQNAWDTLCDKYNNKPLRFSIQMRTLERLASASKETAEHLSLLLSSIEDSITCMKHVGRPTEHWDDLYVYFIVSRLADTTRLDWVKHAESSKFGEFPKYAQIKAFIQQRIKNLDYSNCKLTSDVKKPHSKQSTDSKFHQNKNSNSFSAMKKGKPNKPVICSFCQADHFITYCEKFMQSAMSEKKKHVSANNLCVNCLNPHSLEACVSKKRCFLCGEKHHSRLHEVPGGQKFTTAQCSTTSTVLYLPNEPQVHSTTKSLLSTALVIIRTADGRSVQARVLLDSCAEDSFISEHLAQSLSLKKEKTEVVCSGLGGKSVSVARSRVTAILCSRFDSQFQQEFSALVLKRVAADTPSEKFSAKGWAHLQNLQLADPGFNIPGRIDAIFSSQILSTVLQSQIRKGLLHHPSALQTVLGWVIIGARNLSSSHHHKTTRSVLHAAVSNDNILSASLTKFWELESVPSANLLLPEEEACLQHFRKTCSHDENGRFVLQLPFKQQPELPNSRAIAETCVNRLLRKFNKQPELAEAYKRFMSEYLSLHHMELVTNEEENQENCNYIPHHGVFKNDKLRVVFNASLKLSNGKSLNSYLHVGPKLQEDVVVILLRWCFYPKVFSSDVVKMFRQFLIHLPHQDWQRILWRSSFNEPVQAYRLSTVTYGEACAPFQANACLLQLATECESKFPRVAEILRKNRYVDDFYVGEDTVDELTDVKGDLIQVLYFRGIKLGKWATNSPEIFEDTQKAAFQDDKSIHHEEDVVSTLGLRWIASEDSFFFKFSEESQTTVVTKRTILSQVAKLYDPMGFLAAITILGKIIMQNLWLLKLGWDDPVPENILTSWLDFKKQLSQLEQIRIPRWTGTYKDSVWDLHCFCDASERAYGATIYVTVHQDSGFSSKLITAKAKVSPIRVVSLPRLELCGAHRLAQLATYVIANLEIQPVKTFCCNRNE